MIVQCQARVRFPAARRQVGDSLQQAVEIKVLAGLVVIAMDLPGLCGTLEPIDDQVIAFLEGRADVSADIAQMLERITKTPAYYWIRSQKLFDLAHSCAK